MSEEIPISQIAEEIGSKIGLPLPQYHDEKLLLQQLAERINHLIVHDFGYLVSLLYRLDISEKKLKQLLAENETADAGMLIAEMIVQRQAEKINSRRQFKQNDSAISDEEKW
jgi:hypothetical protein